MSEEVVKDNVVSIDRTQNTPVVDQEEQRKALTRAFWTDVLMQIVDTPKFLEWFDASYTVMKGMDEETKTIHVQVIEKPPIDKAKYHIPNDQIFKIQVACMQSGVRDSTGLLKRILKILGQEMPLVQMANESDLKNAVSQEDLKSKLDV